MDGTAGGIGDAKDVQDLDEAVTEDSMYEVDMSSECHMTHGGAQPKFPWTMAHKCIPWYDGAYM